MNIMNYLSGDIPPHIRGDVVRAIDDHVLNRNGQFRLGTYKLTYPINYRIPYYKVQEERISKDRESSEMSHRKDNIPFMYRQHWGLVHRFEHYIFFPERHPVDTARHAEHQPRVDEFTGNKYTSEYLNPLRPAMMYDCAKVAGRIMNRMFVDLKDICGFCLGHQYPEDCRTFDSPWKRQARLSNVNFSLHLEKSFQLCLGCMSREVGHVEHDKCMNRVNCCYCGLPGHHKSICTSVFHYKALATKMHEEDEATETKRKEAVAKSDEAAAKLAAMSEEERAAMPEEEPDEAVDRSPYVVRSVEQIMFDFYEDDRRHIRDTCLELQRRVREIQNNVISAYKDNYLQRLLNHEKQLSNQQQHADDKISQAAAVLANAVDEPEHQVSNIKQHPGNHIANAPSNCMYKPNMDVHFEHSLELSLDWAMGLIRNHHFDATLNRVECCRDFRLVFEQLLRNMRCCTCVSDEPAIGFCKCGRFHLCYKCLVGIRNGQRELITADCRTCLYCQTTIPAPATSDQQKDKPFVELVMIVRDHIRSLISGLIMWAKSEAPTPNVVGYCNQVMPSFDNLYRQFTCHQCNKDMNCITRAITKYSCKCGAIICRSCLIKDQMEFHVEHHPDAKITCSKDLVSSEVICRKCGGDITFFGTCVGLSVLSNITSHVLKAMRFEDTQTLKQLYDNKVALRNTKRASILNDNKMAAEAEAEADANRSAARNLQLSAAEEREKENLFEQEENELIEEDPELLLRACEQVLGHSNVNDEENLGEDCNAQEQNEEHVELLPQDGFDPSVQENEIDDKEDEEDRKDSEDDDHHVEH